MICVFLEELKKLRKSSIESIEDGNYTEFDAFKKYLHIIRDVEVKLTEIVKETNQTTKRTLILICGSAGDGKSHLLSVMKNNSENLLENYLIHNDATESFEPSKSSTETLNDVLEQFNDNNLKSNEEGKNLIIGINLGTLNNFLESEYAQNFQTLSEFVSKRNILAGKIGDSNYLVDSPFQSISFGDFNNYTLTENGVEVEFIVELINKITFENENNIFCSEYHQVGDTCTKRRRCPVRHNYTLLQNENVQRNIALKLVEMSIKDKYFLSTREILDYIYNIIVHPNFEDNKLFKILNDSEYLKNYIDYTLPSLMYEQTESSEISKLITKYEHLKNRDGDLDEEIISFNVSTDIEEICKQKLNDTMYTEVMTKENLQNLVKNSTDKTKIFKLLSRTNHLLSLKTDNTSNEYQEFLKYLYYFNAGRVEKLQELYKMVINSISKWNGCLEENCLRINKGDSIAIYSDVSLNPSPIDKGLISDTNLIKFENNIIVSFKKNDNKDADVKLIRIDYALYSMIHQINLGYFPNAQDKQTFIEFDSFVTSLYDLSNAKTKVYTIDSENRKGVFELTPFGYEFKVI